MTRTGMTRTGMTRLLNRRRGDRGVSMVEAAIVLPLIVLLLLGTVEGGFAYRDGNVLARAVDQSSRAGSRVATGDYADYEALRSLDVGLGALSASSVERVVIFDAGPTGGSVPSGCLTIARPDTLDPVGVSGVCNVYSPSQVDGDAPASFGNCSTTWDAAFCPASRTRDGETPTRLGVFVELRFDMVTHALPTSMRLTRTAVYVLEPCVAGASTC